MGRLYTEVHKLNGIYRNIHQIANYYPEDPFIFRLAKNFKNYELVRDNEAGEEYKRPVVLHATPGSDSIVGNNIDYAILPGNGEGCLILIADNAGKSMAPYFTEHYENVVVFDLTKYAGEDYKQIIEGLDVTEVLVAQSADYMGLISYSKFLNSFME